MASTESFKIDTSEFNLDLNSVASSMGYSHDNIPEPVLDAVNEILPNLSEYIDAQGGYTILSDSDIKIEDNHFLVNEIQFDAGQIIASQLKGSSIIAFLVATAGPGISELSAKYIDEGDTFRGYIADSIGSLVAELCADIINQKIDNLAQVMGLATSNRLSPGYCDWNVVEQRKLFKYFPDGFAGVHLNESSLMIPLKSVSAVVGMGPEIQKGDHPCSICDRKDCYRRNSLRK